MKRRHFLIHAGRLGALGIAASALPSWAYAVDDSPFLERNAWPEHWETKVQYLAGQNGVTANGSFFVRSPFPVPEKPLFDRVEVVGMVASPLKLDLPALGTLTPVKRRATLECAGNGRGLYLLPSTSGTQWERGAVGTAEWSGASFAALLDRAGVKPGAKHVWFEANDRATLPQAPAFIRSVPLELARERGFLATSMNGAALPRLHGGPVRFVLPGWYGMAWAKWVQRIRIEAVPSDNHFMVKGYRYVAPGGDPLKSPPVEAMRVKSVIVSPRPLQQVASAGAIVRGYAWTGGGKGTIRSVEVSGDRGKTWQKALLEGPEIPFAWRAFRATVRVITGGNAFVLARATDDTGATQPAQAEVNVGGYGNNSIHGVAVRA